jgi:hypothetical protein
VGRRWAVAEPADDDILDGDEAVVARILRCTVEGVRVMRREPHRLRARHHGRLARVAARALDGDGAAAAWLRSACGRTGLKYDEVLADCVARQGLLREWRGKLDTQRAARLKESEP